jgi:hypothetical protein
MFDLAISKDVCKILKAKACNKFIIFVLLYKL